MLKTKVNVNIASMNSQSQQLVKLQKPQKLSGTICIILQKAWFPYQHAIAIFPLTDGSLTTQINTL